MGLIINGNEYVTNSQAGSSRNIGDIFYTTRVDNELNGAVECNGSQYNFADINGGDNNIQALLEAGKLPYVSIGEFDSMVAEQGGCDSFGYGTDELTLYPVKEWKASGDSVLYAYSDKTFYTDYTAEQGYIYFTNSEGEIFTENEDINAYFLTVNLYDKDSLVLMDGYHPYYDTGIVYIKKPNGELISGENQTMDDFSSRNVDAIVKPTGGEFQPTTYFKVPKKIGRVLVRSQKPTADNNYTWYNVYSDGWVEQGGMNYLNPQSSINLPIQMNGSTYSVFAEGTGISDNNNISTKVIVSQTTASVLTIRATYNSGQSANFNCYWQAKGYAASSEYAQSTWDYQNIKVERPMVQLFNGSTDTALATCTSVLADVSSLKSYDYVVEFQEPTAENGYTWYRLYKSGWVEQGGIVPPLPASVTGSTVTFPIEMSTNRYTCFVNTYSPYVDAVIMYANRFKNLTTTSLTIISLQQNSNSTNYVAQTNQSWQVSGMSA